MEETVSHGDVHGNVHAAKPPPKRRRILRPSDIKPVQVYSNKVSSSLHLKPSASLLSEKETSDDGVDDFLWTKFSSQVTRPPAICLSDSEDEAEPSRAASAGPRCPSPPPPPDSGVQKQSRKVTKTINEVNRRLRAVSSVLSPETPARTSRRRRSPSSPLPVEDDDVLIVTSDPLSSPVCCSSVREIPLKVRCRTDVHRVPVLPSAPLSEVVSRLSVILDVPPPRLLLLRANSELSPDSTVGELGFGIADIIECVVMAAEEQADGGSITVRLQSKERDSSQEFSVHREAPLGSVFSRYLSTVPSSSSRAGFYFDGCRLTGSQTAAQLDMEDGDIIEVWM